MQLKLPGLPCEGLAQLETSAGRLMIQVLRVAIATDGATYRQPS
jgi:hypothetical protein